MTDPYRCRIRRVVVTILFLSAVDMACSLPGCTEPARHAPPPSPETSNPAAISNADAPSADNRLRHFGTIKLQLDAPPPSPIRDIADFDLDDRGRIGFYRCGWGGPPTLVLTDVEGTIRREISLAGDEVGDVIFPSIRWLGGEVWMVLSPSVRSRNPMPIRIVDFSTGSVTRLEGLRHAPGDSIAGDRRGGFVIYHLVTESAGADCTMFRYGVITAYDGLGRKRWRYTGSEFDPDRCLPFSAGIAVATDGTVVLLDQNDHSLFLFSSTGEFRGIVASGESRSCIPYDDQVFADRDGGLIRCDTFGHGPTLRICLYNVTTLSQGQASPAPWLRWLVTRGWTAGYTSRELRPHRSDGRRFSLYGGARADPDGRLWVSDGDAFYRLDEDGAVEHIVGEDPLNGILRQIGDQAIDSTGHLYLTNARSGDVHVFDPQGRALRVLKPEPADFQSTSSSQIAVAADGSVYEWQNDARYLIFAPDGTRTGMRKLGDLPKQGELLFQPDGPGLWFLTGDAIHLATLDGKLRRTIRDRPDERALIRVGRAAVAPDGSLAVVSEQSTFSSMLDQRISFYSGDGTALRTVQPPYDDWVLCLAFDGEHLVLRTARGRYDFWLYEYSSGVFRKLEGLVLSENGVQGVPFFAHEGRELWALDTNTRTVERYAIP